MRNLASEVLELLEAEEEKEEKIDWDKVVDAVHKTAEKTYGDNYDEERTDQTIKDVKKKITSGEIKAKTTEDAIKEVEKEFKDKSESESNRVDRLFRNLK